ncbi:MAG: lantibiotic dehydratase, partial [Sphingobacteriia bacterium]|nr:lantibiotic dehydratase [Sphingobacteriia bacterium]
MLNNFSFVLLRTPLNNLKSAFKTPDDDNILFQEGIYLSSKTLFSELEKERIIGKSSNKMDLTLSKYWIRCSTRSTPYGTFAGSSIVTIRDEPTKITLREQKNHYKYVRLDMTCILRIILALNNLPIIYSQVKFFVNNSLYGLPNEFRYAEFIDEGVRKYQLTSFELTD